MIELKERDSDTNSSLTKDSETMKLARKVYSKNVYLSEELTSCLNQVLKTKTVQLSNCMLAREKKQQQLLIRAVMVDGVDIEQRIYENKSDIETVNENIQYVCVFFFVFFFVK